MRSAVFLLALRELAEEGRFDVAGPGESYAAICMPTIGGTGGAAAAGPSVLFHRDGAVYLLGTVGIASPGRSPSPTVAPLKMRPPEHGASATAGFPSAP